MVRKKMLKLAVWLLMRSLPLGQIYELHDILYCWDECDLGDEVEEIKDPQNFPREFHLELDRQLSRGN